VPGGTANNRQTFDPALAVVGATGVLPTTFIAARRLACRCVRASREAQSLPGVALGADIEDLGEHGRYNVLRIR
jgi:hypothetical protein